MERCPHYNTLKCEKGKDAMSKDIAAARSMSVPPMKNVTRADYCGCRTEGTFCPYTKEMKGLFKSARKF